MNKSTLILIVLTLAVLPIGYALTTVTDTNVTTPVVYGNLSMGANGSISYRNSTLSYKPLIYVDALDQFIIGPTETDTYLKSMGKLYLYPGNVNRGYMATDGLHITGRINATGNIETNGSISALGNVTAGDQVFGKLNASSVQNPYWVNKTGDSITGNLNIIGANITITAGYIFAEPLLGMLGSGIINSTQTNQLSEVNVTCTGLTCSYNSFEVRLVDGTSSANSKYCKIAAGSTAVTNNQQNVLYVDSNCAIQVTDIATWFNTQITQGNQWDFANMVCYNNACEVTNGIGIEQRRMMKQRIINFNKNHLSVVSGFTKTANTFPNWTLATGKYIYLMDVNTVPAKYVGGITPTPSSGVEVIWPNTTGWVHSDQLRMNFTTCINSTNNGILTCTNTNRWRRVFFFVVGWNESGVDNSGIHQLLPLDTTLYTTEANCLDTAANPLTYSLPSYYTYSAVPVWAYCVRPADSAWSATGWIDLRTVKTGSATATSTGNFVPYSGATQNLLMGNNNITFGGNDYGINASNILFAPWITLWEMQLSNNSVWTRLSGLTNDNTTLQTNATNLGNRIGALESSNITIVGALGGKVPYTGANASIAMPLYNITINCTVYSTGVNRCFNGTHLIDTVGNTRVAIAYS